MARSVAGAAPSRLNRKFLVVAVLLATLSATLIYAGLSSRRSSSDKSSSSGASQAVVVAKTAIKQRTKITADMLDVKAIGQDAVIAGAYGNLDDVVGKVTKFPIEANQQVVSTAVIDTTRPGTDSLSLVVPQGRRAFSINAQKVVTAGGLLLPGDYVDVVWVCCKSGLKLGGAGGVVDVNAIILSRPVTQNVQVAAVAQQIVSSGPVGTGTTGSAAPADTSGNPVAADVAKQTPDATTITLLVTPEQAGDLIMAENTGELRAALRNPGDGALIAPVSETQFVVPNLISPEIFKVLQESFATKPAGQP